MQGILMTPDNIKAIRDKLKTQTRRPIKPQPIRSVSELKEHSEVKGYWIPYASDRRMVTNNVGGRKDDCGYKPRYGVGETVYIKESYWTESGDIYYKAEWEQVLPCAMVIDRVKIEKWKSPLSMPAWAALYFIKIIDARAERLQEITEENAIAEGIYHIKSRDFRATGWAWSENNERFATPISAFAWLWDSINPKYPWASNPWVWRYEFQRAERR